MNQLPGVYSQSSSTALSIVLEKLEHLDLTHRVQRDGAYMIAHGGFCDVFTGTSSLPGVRNSRTLKVAIKRLRIHLQSDFRFAKVCVLKTAGRCLPPLMNMCM